MKGVKQTVLTLKEREVEVREFSGKMMECLKRNIELKMKRIEEILPENEPIVEKNLTEEKLKVNQKETEIAVEKVD